MFLYSDANEGDTHTFSIQTDNICIYIYGNQLAVTDYSCTNSDVGTTPMLMRITD
jgi:hypothetical protein